MELTGRLNSCKVPLDGLESPERHRQSLVGEVSETALRGTFDRTNCHWKRLLIRAVRVKFVSKLLRSRPPATMMRMLSGFVTHYFDTPSGHALWSRVFRHIGEAEWDWSMYMDRATALKRCLFPVTTTGKSGPESGLCGIFA